MHVIIVPHLKKADLDETMSSNYRSVANLLFLIEGARKDRQQSTS